MRTFIKAIPTLWSYFDYKVTQMIDEVGQIIDLVKKGGSK